MPIEKNNPRFTKVILCLHVLQMEASKGAKKLVLTKSQRIRAAHLAKLTEITSLEKDLFAQELANAVSFHDSLKIHETKSSTFLPKLVEL